MLRSDSNSPGRTLCDRIKLLTTGHGLAVALAAVGAVLFGLAAVRQHGAVQDTMTAGRTSLRENLRGIWRLVRQPAWLLGLVQGAVAGGLHIVALALAPITLVQPVGVLAVPVTVVATAVRARRRPRAAQVLGSIASVAGVAALTVLLLTPAATAVVLPHWGVVAGTAVIAAGFGVLVIMSGFGRSPLLRCVLLATAAAMLFGVNSIFIRLIGHIVRTNLLAAELPVLVAAALGLAIVVPVGLWSMQSAYLAGSPQVVICCLTLIDPVTAVLGGRLMLHDGLTVSTMTLLLAGGCALVAAAGVVLLSREYPVDTLRPVTEGGDPGVVVDVDRNESTEPSEGVLDQGAPGPKR